MTFRERPLDVILHKYRQAVVVAVSVAGECEAWEFQGGGVLLVGLLKQYHIGLGHEVRRSRTTSFGSVWASILSWRIAWLTYGIGGCPP